MDLHHMLNVRVRFMYVCSTHGSVTISLEVHANIKLLGCMMEVFHSSFGTFHCHLLTA